MTANEATLLLAQHTPEGQDGKVNAAEEADQDFALWQIGAFCGILLANADTSLIWATHETIASRFGNLENSSWMMTSFTLGYCVTLPLYTRLSDNYGRHRPLVAAYCTFCIGCAICGIGQTYWEVILGRIIIGCGASGIISLASVIITDIAAPSKVAVLRSYVNVASTIGFSVGGPLGGFLSGTIGWRWSFLGQVPLAAGCCILIIQGIQKHSSIFKDGQPEETGTELNRDVLAFDFPGAISLAIWMSSLLIVIDLHHQLSWGNPLVLGTTIVGSLSMLAFLFFENYPGNRELLIPLRLLKTEIGAFGTGQLLILASGYGLVSQIPPYFANTKGASNAEAGSFTIPYSIGNAIGNLIAGQVIRKFGNYKKLSLVSVFLCIANSVLILFQWSPSMSTWKEVLLTLPLGLFGGMILSSQFIGLYHSAPKEHMVTAIGIYYMSQQIGIALGISITSSLLKQQFKAMLQKMLVDVPRYEEIITNIMRDSSVIALLPTGVQSLVSQSYLRSFWVVPASITLMEALAILPMVSTTEK